MLLSAVGHTAVHVADSGDDVLVDAVVVVVVVAVVDDVDVDDLDGLVLQPIADADNSASTVTARARRFVMVAWCAWMPSSGRAKGPDRDRWC